MQLRGGVDVVRSRPVLNGPGAGPFRTVWDRSSVDVLRISAHREPVAFSDLNNDRHQLNRLRGTARIHLLLPRPVLYRSAHACTRVHPRARRCMGMRETARSTNAHGIAPCCLELHHVGWSCILLHRAAHDPSTARCSSFVDLHLSRDRIGWVGPHMTA